jgi:hypothetical protein
MKPVTHSKRTFGLNCRKPIAILSDSRQAGGDPIRCAARAVPAPPPPSVNHLYAKELSFLPKNVPRNHLIAD